MKIVNNTENNVQIELSRRNLEALLWALDRNENAVLTRHDLSRDCFLMVRAVEDSDHYGARPAGPMPFDEVSA